jgi:hypothetical protein
MVVGLNAQFKELMRVSILIQIKNKLVSKMLSMIIHGCAQFLLFIDVDRGNVAQK